ncbi:MAG: LysR family transcriptional regulator [Alphaproteobacteria bacterium]|nr:LysR family transcriptional regulator [Alphaproteobacteria bacterium]
MAIPIPKLDQVDLRLLRVFATIVDCGGFSSAQVELGIGQSTVSSHMSDLEAKLGVRLCDRGRSGFRLTETGRHVYEATQRVFRSLETFTSEVEALRGRLVGELHIGTIDNVITNIRFPLSSAIARFKRRQSAVSINIHVGTPHDIERAIVDGRLQLGLGTYTNRATGIEYFTLFRERLHLYCGRQHPVYEAAETLSDLNQLRQYEHVKRTYIPDSIHPFGELINATAQASNIEAIALLVLSGQFLGFLPAHYAERWVKSGAMRAVRPDTLIFFAEIELIARRNRARHSIVNAFIDDLIANVGEIPAAAE